MGTLTERAAMLAMIIIALPGLVVGCTSTTPTQPAEAVVRPAAAPVPAPPPPITEVLEGERRPVQDTAPPRLPEVVVEGKRPSPTPTAEKSEPSKLEKLGTIFEALIRGAEWTVKARDPANNPLR